MDAVGTLRGSVSFNHSLASVLRGRPSEHFSKRPRLDEPFLEGHLDRAERAVEADERIADEGGDYVKVDV